MKTHHLKTWTSAFNAVIYGLKTFEFRLNDRDFEVGDILVLQEYDLSLRDYAPGKPESIWRVSYILHGGQFGIPVGYCIMSLKAPEAKP